MNSLSLKYLKVKNFMCFGENGIEINFQNYGNIILLRGENLDVDDEEEKIASNGIGKTSICDAILYGFFGKTSKRVSHKNVINNQNKKKLSVELHWDKFKVIRTRNPDALQLFEDDLEISRGGIPATQKLIEEKIGFNFETFLNVVVFTDDKRSVFLEYDTPDKRKLVENILTLTKYQERFETAKELKKELTENIKMLSRSYESLLAEVDAYKKRLTKIQEQEKDWENSKNNQISNLQKEINETQDKLNKSSLSQELNQYEQAQIRLKKANSEIILTQEKLEKLKEVQLEIDNRILLLESKFNDLKDYKNKLNFELSNLNLELNKNKKIINSFTAKPGQQCPTCYGIVDKKNYQDVILASEQAISKIEHQIQEIQDKNNLYLKQEKELLANYKQVKEIGVSSSVKEKELNENLLNLHKEIANLSAITKPDIGVSGQILLQKIELLNQQLKDKEKESCPFDEILISCKKELETKEREQNESREQLKNIEADLPYYEFWVKGFGDNGIRKFVIDGIIPALNANIQYWLQYLIDGKISLKFDSELQETIERNPSDGDPFVYHAMSGGERQRLNLATSLAFAHIMMLNCGKTPSVIFLDEVTTNIDPIGVVGIYNLIMELSKNKQVFLTTHDQNLLDMLDGCNTIFLRKKDGFSTIV